MVKISGREPQEAGFKSRSVATCSETDLGQVILPLPSSCSSSAQSVHTDHTVAGKTAGWDSAGCQAYRRLSLVGAAVSKPARSPSSGLFHKASWFPSQGNKTSDLKCCPPRALLPYCLRQPELTLCPGLPQPARGPRWLGTEIEEQGDRLPGLGDAQPQGCCRVLKNVLVYQLAARLQQLQEACIFL